MRVDSEVAGAPAQAGRALGPHYKWIALSNTTLGTLMATVNQSIVLIALPDVFHGIGLDPLGPGNTSYLLWMFMGFLVVSAVLVVSFGRLGDMFGRVRMYTIGFAIFTVGSIFLTVTWMHGADAALWLIIWRIVQGIGSAFLFANSAAIVTDAFPANQRGTALSVNSIAAIGGSFIGLILGGALAPVNWHLIFLVSAPIGAFGTVWAYFMLHDQGIRKHAKMDWWGNLLFAVGLVAILVGITYGLQPYGGHPMGWTSPFVLTALFGGLALLVVFVYVETKVAEPLFRISLFKIRAFAAGNIASLMLAMGRGGMQFMLIIWLQGIWLPLHGYSYSETPLWAGIYLIPLTVGFLVSAPLSGILSDKFGAKAFTVGGALLTGATFLVLIFVPVNFPYWVFAAVIAFNGFGSGLFVSPNWAEMMNSVPANQRGAAGGMIATFQNSAFVLSIGIFFTLMVAGLSSKLPSAMLGGLTAQGVPAGAAAPISHLPPIGVLFASFLGYNPMQQLLGPLLIHLSPAHAAYVTGREFFPHLITAPFHDGLGVAFGFAIAACLIAAVASALTGRRAPAADTPVSLGYELAAVAGEGGFEPSELVIPDLPDAEKELSRTGAWWLPRVPGPWCGGRSETAAEEFKYVVKHVPGNLPARGPVGPAHADEVADARVGVRDDLGVVADVNLAGELGPAHAARVAPGQVLVVLTEQAGCDEFRLAHDPVYPRALGHHLEVSTEAFAFPGALAVIRLFHGRLHGRPQVRVDPPDDSGEDLRLGPVVRVEAAGRHPGPGTDVRDRCPAVTALAEQFLGGRQQALCWRPHVGCHAVFMRSGLHSRSGARHERAQGAGMPLAGACSSAPV
jgi:MFS family permease